MHIEQINIQWSTKEQLLEPDILVKRRGSLAERGPWLGTYLGISNGEVKKELQKIAS